MSQHDFEIANQGFPATRADLNNALQALASLSAGSTEPTTTYAYQLWYDEANDLLKMRNSDDDAFITLAAFDQTNDEWEVRSAVIQAVDSAGVSIKTDDGTTRVEIADDGSVTVNTSLDVDNIKIDGNTISSTDTNGDINITPDGTGKVVIDGLNYPTADGSDGQVLTTDGSGNIAFEDAAGGGITHSCTFRLTANKSSNGVLSANLEESDDASYSGIGSPLTESSGVFTFPVTGIWQVTSYALFRTTSLDTIGLLTEVSTDGGSNWDTVADEGGSSSGGNDTGSCTALIDCTSTANVKVRFNLTSVSGGSDIAGDTNSNRTHFIFTRLGDT